VDPILFVTDPDPDLTFQRVSDPDPTLNIDYFSRTMIVKVFTSVVYPILFVTDPDPDLTFQRVSDPDPTFKKFLIRFGIRP
jgi:hypothetical protein